MQTVTKKITISIIIALALTLLALAPMFMAKPAGATAERGSSASKALFPHPAFLPNSWAGGWGNYGYAERSPGRLGREGFDSGRGAGTPLTATGIGHTPPAIGGPLGAQAVIGSQPWVVLLCRVSDSDLELSDPVAWYTELMGNQHPGFNHYWQELSFGAMNITGTLVSDVYTLTKSSSYYWNEVNGIYFFNTDHVFDDCTAAADADVFFPDFVGIHIILPAPASYLIAPAQALPGGRIMTRDGQTKTYAVTLISTEKPSHALLAHEWGHGLGLFHSSGPYNSSYDSGWDVMSGGGPFGYPCHIPSHPDFGCLGQHTIAFHKDKLGWIPPSRVFTATAGISQTIAIEPLDTLPAQGGSYLYAKIPIVIYGQSGYGWYSVEARRLAGYDAGLPAPAIVIHLVDTFYYGNRQAQVVDIDQNGNPNDDGARWLPGETFLDSANGVVLCVESETPTGGFTVTIGLYADACGVTFERVYLPVIIRQ